MPRQPLSPAVHDLFDERVELRVRLSIMEDRGAPEVDLKIVRTQLSEVNGKIKKAISQKLADE